MKVFRLISTTDMLDCRRMIVRDGPTARHTIDCSCCHLSHLYIEDRVDDYA